MPTATNQLWVADITYVRLSRPGNPYDNAKCERFMKTLKQEEICCFEYRDIDHLRANLSAFLDRS